MPPSGSGASSPFHQRPLSFLYSRSPAHKAHLKHACIQDQDRRCKHPTPSVTCRSPNICWDVVPKDGKRHGNLDGEYCCGQCGGLSAPKAIESGWERRWKNPQRRLQLRCGPWMLMRLTVMALRPSVINQGNILSTCMTATAHDDSSTTSATGNIAVGTNVHQFGALRWLRNNKASKVVNRPVRFIP
jgi:hypothetical protein